MPNALTVTTKRVKLNKLVADGLYAMVLHHEAPKYESIKFSYSRFNKLKPDYVFLPAADGYATFTTAENHIYSLGPNVFLSEPGLYQDEHFGVHMVYRTHDGYFLYNGTLYDDILEESVQAAIQRTYMTCNRYVVQSISELQPRKDASTLGYCANVSEVDPTAVPYVAGDELAAGDVVYIRHPAGVVAWTIAADYRVIDSSEVPHLSGEVGDLYVVSPYSEPVQIVRDHETDGIFAFWDDRLWEMDDLYDLYEQIGNKHI